MKPILLSLLVFTSSVYADDMGYSNNNIPVANYNHYSQSANGYQPQPQYQPSDDNSNSNIRIVSMVQSRLDNTNITITTACINHTMYVVASSGSGVSITPSAGTNGKPQGCYSGGGNGSMMQ